MERRIVYRSVMPFGFLKRVKAVPAKPRTTTRVEERAHTVAGRTLPLRIVENDRAKRLTLRIDAGGQGLRVTVPRGMANRDVESFLSRHRGWLEQRLSKVPQSALVRAGIEIPIGGMPHRIVHRPGRGTAELARGDIGPNLIVYGDERHLPRRVADFLKKQARATILPLVETHSRAVGRKVKAVRFKDTTSRWGSCSADGTLSFSWRIMMAPPEIIDYLVAHEVAHLKEMNHGPRFWELCKLLCPDTERCRAWLKANGTGLQAIVFE